jgi:ankyrin repeat protein
MTATDFRKNEMLRTALHETLNQNHVKMALAILRDIGEPREITPPPGISFMEFNATQNTRREGYFQALSALETLAVLPSKAPSTRDIMPSLLPE